MIGINVPIPVPVAYHSFGGWKASLFGDAKAYGAHGVRLLHPQEKAVTSRWLDPSHGGVEPRLPAARLRTAGVGSGTRGRCAARDGARACGRRRGARHPPSARGSPHREVVHSAPSRALGEPGGDVRPHGLDPVPVGPLTPLRPGAPPCSKWLGPRDEARRDRMPAARRVASPASRSAGGTAREAGGGGPDPTRGQAGTIGRFSWNVWRTTVVRVLTDAAERMSRMSASSARGVATRTSSM